MKYRFLVFTCLAVSSTALADTADDVRCYETQFSQSVESRDIESFKSFIDADARFISDIVSRGPDAVATAWSAFFAVNGPGIKWRSQFVEVLEDGTLALSRGPYKMTVRDEADNVSEHWGTFNSVWRLQEDGSWRVVFDAGSPASNPPSDEVQALLDQVDNCADRND